MNEFPVTIEQRRYADRAALVEALRAWGHARARRHRGDVHSADRWNAALARDPAIAPAIAAAASTLLRTSDDAGVLELIAHLTLPIHSGELFEALLDRLGGGGPPLPAGAGLRHGTLEAELAHHLADWLPAGMPSLADRARALVQSSPHARAHVAFACRDGESPDELIAALRRAGSLDVDPYLAVFAVSRAIARSPARALEIAGILAENNASPALRERVAREIARIHPDWHGRLGPALRTALGLSG